MVVSADDIIDTHICGACRTKFHNVDLFLHHKRHSCPAVLRSAATSATPRQAATEGHQGPISPVMAGEESPRLTVQDGAVGTSPSGDGVGPTVMITPPQGHEYIQTNQRQDLVPRTNQNKARPQIILTEKGELIVVHAMQTDASDQSETEINQGQAMVNLIQYLRTNPLVHTDTSLSPQSTPEVVMDSSAPEVQLDQTGSMVLMSTSHLPVSEQLHDGQPESSGHNLNLMDQTGQQSLTDQHDQPAFDPACQLEAGHIGGHPVIHASDLAQQAARLSGVEGSDLQNVAMDTDPQQDDLDTVQYSINVRNISQQSNMDGVGQLLQIPESNIQENLATADFFGQSVSEGPTFRKFRGKTVIARGAKTHCSPSKSPAKSCTSAKSSDGSPSKSAGTTGKTRNAPVKKFKCHYDDKCTFSSAYLKDLERHFRTHTGEKPFSCKYCDRSFSRVDKLHLHTRAHTGDKPYKCKFCDYCAVDSSSLRKHVIVHTDERPHKCQVCPYACRTASQLTVHLRTHTGDSPFPCPFCPAKFKIKSDLRRHLRVHTGEKPYQCEKCHIKCATKGNLASHNRVHHSSENQMKCTTCDFSTSSKRGYKEHVKGHEPGDPDCVCHVCKYQCSNREVLRSHLARHEKKSYCCSLCYFSTNHKANLVVHLKRRHAEVAPKKPTSGNSGKGKRPKSCDIKVAKVVGSSGKFTKAFACHICPESFVRKDSLRSHIRLHEEMANSTLTTALTVLKLQQPVINPSLGGPNRVQPQTDGGIKGRGGEGHPYHRINISPLQTSASANFAEDGRRYENEDYNQNSLRDVPSQIGDQVMENLGTAEYRSEGRRADGSKEPELGQVPREYFQSIPRQPTSLESAVIISDMRSLSSNDITIVEPRGIAEARKMLLYKQSQGLQAVQEGDGSMSVQTVYHQTRSENPSDPSDLPQAHGHDYTSGGKRVMQSERLVRQDVDTDPNRYSSHFSRIIIQNPGEISRDNLENAHVQHTGQGFDDRSSNVMDKINDGGETQPDGHQDSSDQSQIQYQHHVLPGIQLVQNISLPVIRFPTGQLIPSFSGQTLNQLIGGAQLHVDHQQGELTLTSPLQQGEITLTSPLQQGEITLANPLQQGEITLANPLQQGEITLTNSLQQREINLTNPLQGEITINTLQPGELTLTSPLQQRELTLTNPLKQREITLANLLQQGQITFANQQGESNLSNPIVVEAQLQDGESRMTLPIQICSPQGGAPSLSMVGDGIAQLLDAAGNPLSNSIQVYLPRTDGQPMMTCIGHADNQVTSNHLENTPSHVQLDQQSSTSVDLVNVALNRTAVVSEQENGPRVHPEGHPGMAIPVVSRMGESGVSVRHQGDPMSIPVVLNPLQHTGVHVPPGPGLDHSERDVHSISGLSEDVPQTTSI